MPLKMTLRLNRTGKCFSWLKSENELNNFKELLIDSVFSSRMSRMGSERFLCPLDLNNFEMFKEHFSGKYTLPVFLETKVNQKKFLRLLVN